MFHRLFRTSAALIDQTGLTDSLSDAKPSVATDGKPDGIWVAVWENGNSGSKVASLRRPPFSLYRCSNGVDPPSLSLLDLPSARLIVLSDPGFRLFLRHGWPGLVNACRPYSRSFRHNRPRAIRADRSNIRQRSLDGRLVCRHLGRNGSCPFQLICHPPEMTPSALSPSILRSHFIHSLRSIPLPVITIAESQTRVFPERR